MSTEEQTLGPECPICLEKNSNICLPCGNFHWVHRKCWEQVVDKTKCLICKQSLEFSPHVKPGVPIISFPQVMNPLQITDGTITSGTITNGTIIVNSCGQIVMQNYPGFGF